MAVWSVASLQSVIDTRRIDADHYRPEYLRITALLSWAPPLKQFVQEIIHPAEFSRRYSDDGWKVVRTQNVRPLRTDFDSNEVFLSEKIANGLNKNHLRSGDILITRTGANFGQCSLFYAEEQPALATSHTFIVRANEKIDSAYLALFLNTTQGRQLIDRGMYGSSQPEIAPRFLLRIPTPRFAESIEAELAMFVRKAYGLRKESISLYKQAQHLLESDLGLDKRSFKKPVGYTAQFSELQQSRRLDAEYFDPVASSLVERISTFDHVRLGANCNVGNGFPWNSKKFLEDNSGEPVVRIRNIRPSHIDVEELSSIDPKYARNIGFPKAKKGDVIVGMDGIKYFYASLLEGDCYVNQRVAHLTWHPGAKISPEYATFIINSSIGQAQLLRDMTVATTVGHITNRNIFNLLIPFVSNAFHRKITNLVKQSIDKKQESKRLLYQAKTRVEQLIEEAVGS